MAKQKLDERAFAYTLAVISAGFVVLITVFSYLGLYLGAVASMIRWHMFYTLDPLGIVLGIAESSIWGLFTGYAIAWVYNKFS